MIVHDCIQGSAAWLQLRSSIPTASNFNRIVTAGGKPSTQADGYLYELAAEAMLGRPLENVKTSWMHRGTVEEKNAVTYYELLNDCKTKVVGLITNDAGTMGASPDRLVEPVGTKLLECKAPSPQIHVRYVLFPKKGVDAEYRVQLQAQLYITEYQETDILSYHPDMPSALVNVKRDEEFIKLMAIEAEKFVARLEEIKEDLDKRGMLFKPQPASSPDFITDDDLKAILDARRRTAEVIEENKP